MKSPLVSILIPVFNREKLIANCIQSALDQTFADFEIVVVDNCSTDGTWDVCKSFAAADGRVRIFRNDRNIGPVLNWQRCINEAKGAFGKVLFSDDLLAEDCLAKMAPFLVNDEGVGFVISAVNLGESPTTGRLVAKFADNTGKFPIRQFVEASLYGGQVTVSPGNALFRMSDLRKNLKLDIPSPTISNFLGHGAGPDLLLYLLATQTYPSFVYVNEPLCFFRSHEGSITASTRSEEITRYYTQASIWFAEQYLDQQEIKRYFVYAWYRACQNSRPKRWVRPSTYLRDFTARSDTPLLLPILKFAAHKLGRKLGLVRSVRDFNR
jgi:glycosyltransferase involved in cell wall biosynthesis